MPNLTEPDLAREEIWNFELRSLDKDRPRKKSGKVMKKSKYEQIR